MVKPLTFDFDRYRLEIHRNHFKLYEQRQLTVWEGSLAFSDMGLSPTTHEQVTKTPELCKQAIKAIRGKLTPYQKRKREVAVWNLLDCAIPGLSYMQKVQATNQL